MSEPAKEPSPSLIQQRLDLQRRRASFVFVLVLQSLGIAAYLAAIIVDGREWYWWLAMVPFAAAVGFTVQQLHAVLRDTRAFAKRYGEDAGLQK